MVTEAGAGVSGMLAEGGCGDAHHGASGATIRRVAALAGWTNDARWQGLPDLDD